MSQASRRAELKGRLFQERGNTCDYCGKDGATDMHEWLIKRSAVPKGKQQLKIFDERNCALLHHTCHLGEGQTRAMKAQLADIFIARYGLKQLLEFVTDLKLRDPSHAQFLIGMDEARGVR